MSAAFTPGPWKAKHRAGLDGNYRIEVFSPTFGGIATCDSTLQNIGSGIISSCNEDNARLIAVSPDLFYALDELLFYSDALKGSAVHSRCVSVIAAATGSAA